MCTTGAMGTPVDWPTWVTTSVSAAPPAPGEFPKFGIGAFSEAVRQEVLGQRVRVGLVEPGTVQTEITTALPPESQAALENRTAGMVNLNLPTSPMPFGLHGDPRPAGCGQRNPRALGRTNLVDRYQR